METNHWIGLGPDEPNRASLVDAVRRGAAWLVLSILLIACAGSRAETTIVDEAGERPAQADAGVTQEATPGEEAPLTSTNAEKRLVELGLWVATFHALAAGLDTGAAVDPFDPGTEAVIRAYQKMNGWPETGELTREQAEALMALGEAWQAWERNPPAEAAPSKAEDVEGAAQRKTGVPDVADQQSDAYAAAEKLPIIVNLAVGEDSAAEGDAGDDTIAGVTARVMGRLEAAMPAEDLAAVRTFGFLPAIALSADGALIARLLAMPEVRSIELDRELQPLGDAASELKFD